MFKRISTVITAVMFAALMVAGCQQAAKKPTPPATPAPKTAPGPRTDRITPAPARKPAAGKMPTSPAELDRLARKLAAEAAKVRGVKQATVVLSGTVAYVGVDLKANLERSATNTVKKDVADRVKKTDRRLTGVYVSTDADTITRIKRVANGISKGRPLSSFAAELEEIGRRLKPQTPRK